MTKHIFGWLIIAGIAVGSLLAQTENIEMGVIKGDRVNVRGRPSPTGEICCQLNRGNGVEILERRRIQTIGTNTEEWVRIVLPEKANVWIQNSYLDPQGQVNAKVNGRAGPSLMWPVLCVFPKG